MARMVRITIDYDMDDTDKPLSAELKDWLGGHVNMADIFDEDGNPSSDESASVTIREIE